jgi:hypothetical protein
MVLRKPASPDDIKALLSHTLQLLGDLEQEYRKGRFAATQELTKARVLTHDIVEKSSNVLDQLMYAVWSKRVRPRLIQLPSRGGYFPAARSEAEYRSALGQWKCADLDRIDPSFDRELRAVQPMAGAQNDWLLELKDLARAKHTGLIPQAASEVQICVPLEHSRRSGPGFTRMSIPIDGPKGGEEEYWEHWVSLVIEGTRHDALEFCKNARQRTNDIVVRFEATLMN